MHTLNKSNKLFLVLVSALAAMSAQAATLTGIIKTAEGTRVTRVKDVGRVEMGAKSYNMFFQTNAETVGMTKNGAITRMRTIPCPQKG